MDSDWPHRLIIQYPINQSIKQIQTATKTIYDRPYIIYSSACVFKLHGQCVIDFCYFGVNLRLSLINADSREVTHFRVTLPPRTFVPAQRCALPLPSLRGLKISCSNMHLASLSRYSVYPLDPSWPWTGCTSWEIQWHCRFPTQCLALTTCTVLPSTGTTSLSETCIFARTLTWLESPASPKYLVAPNSTNNDLAINRLYFKTRKIMPTFVSARLYYYSYHHPVNYIHL